MVRRVQKLPPELELDVFMYGRIFDDGEIQRIQAVSADPREARGKGAKVVAELLRAGPLETGVHVEPAVDGPLAFRDHDVVEIAVEDSITEAQRLPGLPAVDTLHLPTAEKQDGGRGGLRHPLSPSAKRQFVNGADRHAVRVVLIGDHFRG